MTNRNIYAGVLHLKERADRFRNIKKNIKPVLAELGLELNLHDAINTKGAEFNKAPYEKMYKRTPGAIGCMLGQMEILRTALNVGKDALVMEDDILFCSDFKKRFALIQNFMNMVHTDVFWLGGTVHINPPYWHTSDHKELPQCDCTLNRDAEQIPISSYIFRSYGSFSTHAYYVNKESIPKILEWLNAFMPHTIGIDFSFINFGPLMQNFVFLPGCCIQIDNQSNIGTGITKFSGFANLGAHWFQDKLENFNPESYNWAETKIKN